MPGPSYREGELAYKDNFDEPAERNTSLSTFADDGQSSKADKTAQLNSQDLSILERTIRGRVSGLVNALHADVDGEASPFLTETDFDFRLHPELDPKARDLPAADKAISYREKFLRP